MTLLGRTVRADTGLLLCVAMLSAGCASLPPAPGRGRSLRYTPEESQGLSRHRGSRELAVGASPGGVGGVSARGSVQVDAWERLLTDAGLEERDERPLLGSSLTPTQVAGLLKVLLRKQVTLGTFPARMAVGHLLREVLERGEVSRDELLRRVERFARVAVLRPDGYLAWVRTGRTQQKTPPVEWRDGTFRAGPFELGRFYVSNGYVFRLADERLEPVDNSVFVEVYDDADYVSRTLDGAESAFVKLALSLGHFFTYPLDSLAAMKELPAGVAALIASSPEYFERFRYMTRGEQVQAVAELATNLLVTTGTATATTRTVTGALAGAEATVPVLSLSAQGALTIERVAVPVGRAAVVLGGGPGAAIILQRANTAAGQPSPSGDRGPGRWEDASESMSEASRKYQAQVTGAPVGKVYKVQGVKFDGFKTGVLLETKGPGYAKFLKDGSFRSWFRGADGMLEQAKRQFKAAKGTPIQWHFAESEVADAVRDMFRNEGLGAIKVVYTPPSP
jgi:Restriction endonuclease fold toxin 5